MKALFQLGSLHITPGALQFCKEHEIDPLGLVMRHVNGDFGDLCQQDVKANLEAIITGARILSVYRYEEKLYVITEADRASTCILLANEY